MFSRNPIASSERPWRKAFVLLEVLISMTIIAVTLSAVLRSFSQSLKAVRKLEVETQATFFAQQLLDEFEINPPEEGRLEGGFGDDYWQYYFIVEIEYEEPDYDEGNRHEEISQFFPFRTIHIEIRYDNGIIKPFRALSVDSAIMGFERFSAESKTLLGIF